MTQLAVDLWRQLREYLQVEMEVGPKEMIAFYQGVGRSHELEAVNVKVEVSNRAPAGPDYPNTVFLGVGLSAGDLRRTSGRNIPSWLRDIRTYKVEDSVSQQTTFVRAVSEQHYRDVTSDEKRFGDVLFPGQSIKYEVNIPFEDYPHFGLRVEGGVSRRHFFRCEHMLPLPSRG